MKIVADAEIAPSEDILERTAGLIIEQQQASFPNLQSINVIFPDASVSNAFRFKLLTQLPSSTKGIIPPWTGTLKKYLQTTSSRSNHSYKKISAEGRRLLFIETLDEHPNLYNDENKWQVTASLLTLFDELYLANPDILNVTQDEWLATLENAYNVKNHINNLRNEAELVQTLWLAWQKQLKELNLIDPVFDYAQQLTNVLNNSNEYMYVVTTTNFSPTEHQLIQSLQEKNRCYVIEYQQDSMVGNKPITQFINATFDNEKPFSNQHSIEDLSPSDIHFSFYPAKNDEAEACAVDLQIRKWLLDGKSNIGVVCENRKLSRRIRALLERANVTLQDLSGWSLATTSAAAVLESWLQCIEEDFNHKPLLDLLKSHFFAPNLDNDFHYQAIYRLEHDIILHENVSANLSRYKKQLKTRANRLNHWPDKTYSHVTQLLNTLDETAQPLVQLYQMNKKKHLSVFLTALQNSLETLNINHAFSLDDAGKTILECLNEMQNGLDSADPEMLWSDFRIWLGINMESKLFLPKKQHSAVSLLTLKQSELKQFDALVVAATDKQHFPGSANQSAFFNQNVKAALGLDDWRTNQQKRLNQFKNLLHASDHLLITYKQEDKGEAIPLSPWVSALQNNLLLSFGHSFINETLMIELSLHSSVTAPDNIELPNLSQQPSTAIPNGLIPSKISARSHQSLISCPYQYFAGDALFLKPAEEISDELQKSDYGQIVHRILQIFHQPISESSNVKPLVPFNKKIIHENKQLAINHLMAISEKCFKHELEFNLLHKSWLYRWKKQIPSYINWQIKHQENWSVESTEQIKSNELNNDHILFGRIDRIDQNKLDNKTLVIDYKTGNSAKQDTIESGEDVQLVSYALLNKNISDVFYLNLDDNKRGVVQGASLSDEPLQDLKTASINRLNTIMGMTHDNYPLTAWGDEKTCGYCQYEGICRKPYWS